MIWRLYRDYISLFLLIRQAAAEAAERGDWKEALRAVYPSVLWVAVHGLFTIYPKP